MQKLTSSRRFLVLAVLVLIFAMTAAFAVGCGDDGFSISEVQHDPFAFAGEITINGTVAQLTEDPSFFGVMDTNELMQCGSFDCGHWIMPTLYVGGQPLAVTHGDNVVLTGQFVNDGMGAVFQVTDMSVGNNIMNQLP